jgi:hypothetical protein
LQSKEIVMTTVTGRPAQRGLRRPRASLVRLGRNEALARRPSPDRTPRHWEEPLPFQCECDGERCRETIVLTRGEYRHARARAGWLIVAPGHQVEGAEFRERLRGCFVVAPLDGAG